MKEWLEHRRQAKRLRDPDFNVRWRAVSTLEELGTPRARRILAKHLDGESHAQVRFATVASLASLGEPSAVARVRGWLKDPKHRDKRWAERAVYVLTADPDPEGLEAVLEFLGAHGFRFFHPTGLGILARALGACGDVRMIPWLEKLLTRQVKDAPEALRQLGWKADTPEMEVWVAVAERRLEGLHRYGEPAAFPLKCLLTDENVHTPTRGTAAAELERLVREHGDTLSELTLIGLSVIRVYARTGAPRSDRPDIAPLLEAVTEVAERRKRRSKRGGAAPQAPKRKGKERD